MTQTMTKKGEMMAALEEAEAALPHLLDDDPSAWNSLDVDYEPPRVERLWRPLNDRVRVFLHVIHPCEKALFHPHPWPSAVKILLGRYEMGIGSSAGNEPPNEVMTTILKRGSSYEMVDRDGWHSVRPLGGISASLMVTGPAWDRWAPRPERRLKPLEDDQKLRQLKLFRELLGLE